MDFVSIDFEKANDKSGSACQVGLVRVRDSKIVDKFESNIRPKDELSKFGAWQKANLSLAENDLSAAPTIAEILPDLVTFIGSDYLVAHQASTDMSIFRHSLDTWGLALPEFRVICSLTFARSEIPQKPHGLAPLCEKFGVHLPSHHDALSDAHACAELMIKLAGVANVHNIGHLYPNFAYRASSGNASFGFVNNKLDKDREAFYSNLNDIKDFFKQDPETLDFMALPLTGKTVSAIRGFFDLTQNELATWVEALGGTFIDFDINNPSDIILQGNRVSPDAKIKREQTNAVIKLSKIAINEAKFAGIFIDSLNLN